MKFILSTIIVVCYIGIVLTINSDERESRGCRDSETADRLRDGSAALQSADSNIRILLVLQIICKTFSLAQTVDINNLCKLFLENTFRTIANIRRHSSTASEYCCKLLLLLRTYMLTIVTVLRSCLGVF
jgi:hypothetical protein